MCLMDSIFLVFHKKFFKFCFCWAVHEIVMALNALKAYLCLPRVWKFFVPFFVVSRIFLRLPSGTAEIARPPDRHRPLDHLTT